MARRGSYAKGVAKREEILEHALDVIAREGFRGASVKELAQAAGLSQAGLLHYFGSKEELFLAILRKRDERDAADFAEKVDLYLAAHARPMQLEHLRESYVGVVRHNADVPGLVELFSRMATEAASASHPAHQYFLERSAGFTAVFVEAIRAQQASGTMTDRVDPVVLARMFQAVADGMQLQWLLDPDVDMAKVVDALFEVLTPVDARPARADAGPARAGDSAAG
jgi:AcrR family transcriptional regulator